jgi:hypothetical protein
MSAAAERTAEQQAIAESTVPGRGNGRVGQVLVSESERVRVWLISLQPGESLAPHCHVLDYFWTVTAPGRARSVYHGGRVVEMDYALGDTKHIALGAGEWFVHDLQNIGSTTLGFTTVEFLDGANAKLPV